MKLLRQIKSFIGIIIFVGALIVGSFFLLKSLADSDAYYAEQDKIVWELTTEDGEVYFINHMWQESRNDIVSGYDVNTGKKVYASGNWRLVQR